MIMSVVKTLWVAVAAAHVAHALLPTTNSRPLARVHGNYRRVSMAESGKGFGKTPPPPKPSATPAPPQPPSPSAEASSSVSDKPEYPEISPSAAKMLEEMRQKKEQDRVAQDAQYERIKEVDAVLAEDKTAGVIPEKVATRMLGRMLPLAGVPIFGGIALFVTFYLSATKWDLEIQPAVVAYATTVPWLLGLAGLTYGVLSSSWDEEIEGSFLGVDEFKTNIGRIFEGISRSGQDRAFREDYEERMRKEQNAATMNRE